MHSVTMVTVKTTSLQGQNFIILNEQVRQTVWDVILAVCHYDQLKKKRLISVANTATAMFKGSCDAYASLLLPSSFLFVRQSGTNASLFFFSQRATVAIRSNSRILEF